MMGEQMTAIGNTRRITALAVIAKLTACGESGGLGGSFQPGQIIGGGTKQMADVQPVPGFLPDPSLLRRGGSGQADLVYRSPTANFASYNKVILGSWSTKMNRMS